MLMLDKVGEIKCSVNRMCVKFNCLIWIGMLLVLDFNLIKILLMVMLHWDPENCNVYCESTDRTTLGKSDNTIKRINIINWIKVECEKEIVFY